MGIKPSEWSKLVTSLIADGRIGSWDDLLPMSERDTRLALKMCQRDISAEWK